MDEINPIDWINFMSEDDDFKDEYESLMKFNREMYWRQSNSLLTFPEINLN